MSRTTIMIIGGGIGVLWLAMAAATFLTAYNGWANQRPDWAFGWGLVGVLLTLAGGSAIVGTWLHQYRLREHD